MIHLRDIIYTLKRIPSGEGGREGETETEGKGEGGGREGGKNIIHTNKIQIIIGT